jgi:hypothetical protein
MLGKVMCKLHHHRFALCYQTGGVGKCHFSIELTAQYLGYINHCRLAQKDIITFDYEWISGYYIMRNFIIHTNPLVVKLRKL